MENAWQQFLIQLASADLEFTYDDVCGWTAEEFEALSGAGLINETTPATHVVCDVCPEAHWERVRWSENGKRPFIPCPVAGTTDVTLERLRRWRISLLQFSVRLAQALTLSGEVQPLPESRLWFLGRRRTARHTPYFFFAAIGPDELPSTMEAVRNGYGRITGVLLLPFSLPDHVETGNLRIVNLHIVASLHAALIITDLGFIENQLSDADLAVAQKGARAKKASRLLAAHRRAILKAFMTENSLVGMEALAWRLGVSKSALHGMARGDKTRYREDTLNAVMKKIGCPRPTWDRAAKPAARA